MCRCYYRDFLDDHTCLDKVINSNAVKPIARSEAECKIVEDKTAIQNKVNCYDQEPFVSEYGKTRGYA